MDNRHLAVSTWLSHAMAPALTQTARSGFSNLEKVFQIWARDIAGPWHRVKVQKDGECSFEGKRKRGLTTW